MVVRLRRQASRLVLRFHESSRVDPARLTALVRKRRDVRVTPDNEVSVPCCASISRASSKACSRSSELGVEPAERVDTREKTRQMADGSAEVRR